MSPKDKPLVWLYGEVKAPPFSTEAKLEAGHLLRQLQKGVKLVMPQSKPMTTVGKRCGELRITDKNVKWRIMYRTDDDAVIILEVFKKKDGKTPKPVIDRCKARLKDYDATS